VNRWLAVLDDSLSRVAALREAIAGSGYDVVHAVRVTSFFCELDNAIQLYQQPPAVILLDHDLGIGSFEDIDGNNGLDAAKQLAEGHWRKWLCPVLIWTTNRDAAPHMKAALQEAWPGRGPLTIATIPYDRPEAWQPWVRERLA